MSKALRVLLVQDSPDDASALLDALSNDGCTVTSRRVESAGEMHAALTDASWDVVVSDYSLQHFSGTSAIQLLHETGQDLPFIIVSAPIGETATARMLKAGAHDLLLKGDLDRLGEVIEQQRHEARQRAAGKSANENLRQSEGKFRRIVETSKEGIWITDAEGLTTYVNERMAALLGSTPGALTGTNIRDHVDIVARSVIDAFHQGAGTSELDEVEIQRADQTRFMARLSAGRLPDEQGNSDGTLFMVTDLTGQRKVTEQLLVADRMQSLGMLAAGVAHEINNPLASLIANLEIINDGIAALPADVQASLKSHECFHGLMQARESAERVRQIARDLRVYTRADEDRRESVDLQLVIEASVRLAQIEICHRARFTHDYHKTAAVSGSPSRLGQVFLNLLVNAAQSIPEGAVGSNEIHLTLRPDGEDHVVVEIRDTGCGMSPDVISRVFTPFFTTKAVGLGTGLGLPICKQIIDDAGGTITIESAPGAGSTFRVRLPVAAQACAAPLVTVASAPATARRHSVLVVDDEPALVNSLKRLLGGFHDMTGHTKAGEALNDIRAGKRFDVILCDLMMPEMTGMALHAALMDTDPDQAKRMIFLTGGAFTQQAVNFLKQDGIHHLDKPCDRATMLAAIDTCCRA